MDSLKARATKQGAPSSHVAVFDWFRNKLLPACPEVSITQGELEGHMALAEQRRFDQPPVDAHVPWDKQVSLLVRAGLLARQVSLSSWVQTEWDVCCVDNLCIVRRNAENKAMVCIPQTNFSARREVFVVDIQSFASVRKNSWILSRGECFGDFTLVLICNGLKRAQVDCTRSCG